MIDFHEWDWDALSHMLTPANLKKLLTNSSPESAEYFLRVKSLVFFHMFKTLDYKINHFAKIPRSLVSVRKLFETDLMENGFIPHVPLRRSVVSNDFFGFVNDRGKWIEWNICSIEIMRLYWDNMLQSVTSTHKKFIDSVCQKILCLLPGSTQECQHCQWLVPASAMYSDHFCNYCHCKSQDGVLKQFKTLPYLQFSKSPAVKT